MGRKRVLGTTTDFLTGREIKDTDDERLLQKIARFLVERKGYERSDIERRRRIGLLLDGREAFSLVDYIVSVGEVSYIAIKYGPGSLVTRERPALAAARIADETPIPFTVVTNGMDAELLDTQTGEVIGTGLEAIPARSGVQQVPKLPALSQPQKEAEMRILSAYDYIEHSLECDDDWCEP